MWHISPLLVSVSYRATGDWDRVSALHVRFLATFDPANRKTCDIASLQPLGSTMSTMTTARNKTITIFAAIVAALATLLVSFWALRWGFIQLWE